MISIVELKKHIANINIFGIIINELCNKKKQYLIILLKVDKGLKIDFHCIILPFSLVICLRVKGDRESSLNA